MNQQNDLFSVAGQRVLITGSTRGIGYAMAEQFSRAGATVIVTGRKEEAVQSAAARLGANALGVAVDVASEASVERAAEAVHRRLGGIDVLINNAGIDPHYASLDKTTSDEWHALVKTNLDGVFFCCKHFTPSMRENRAGSIINISSVAGKVGLKRQVPYCATKGGVDQITRALAIDWAEAGIRVNGIGYGFIRTDLTAAITSHDYLGQQLRSRTPMARFGEVSEVAGAAIFLASPAASYITGHTIMVDGGWTAA